MVVPYCMTKNHSIAMIKNIVPKYHTNTMVPIAILTARSQGFRDFSSPLLATFIMPSFYITHLSVLGHLFGPSASQPPSCSSRMGRRDIGIHLSLSVLDLLQHWTQRTTDSHSDGREAETGVLIGVKCIKAEEKELLHGSKWWMNCNCQVYKIKEPTPGDVSRLFYSRACILRKLF